MTAIVYRDGIMAADSGTWQGNILAGRDFAKIRRLDDGRVVGIAGRASDADALFEWLETGEDPLKRPPKVEPGTLCALIVKAGAVWRVEWDMRPFPAAEAPYHAIGAHTEFLLGALAAGATAEAAVTLAVRYGDSASGPVVVVGEEGASDGRVSHNGRECIGVKEERCRGEGC